MLMWMSWGSLMVVLISINEKYENNTWLFRNIKMINAFCFFIIGVNFFFITNISYMSVQQRWEKDYGLCVRLVDRIEQIDQWNPETPIYIYGTFLNERMYPKTSIASDAIRGMTGLEEEHIFNTDFHYQQFIKNYLGVTIKLASEEEKKMVNNKSIEKMPTWPAKESVCIIKDIIVIKMNQY